MSRRYCEHWQTKGKKHYRKFEEYDIAEIIDVETRKVRDLKSSGYSASPSLCSKGWCSPLERMKDKWTPCGGSEVLARRRRFMQNECSTCEKARKEMDVDRRREFMRSKIRCKGEEVAILLANMHTLMKVFIEAGSQRLMIVLTKKS